MPLILTTAWHSGVDAPLSSDRRSPAYSLKSFSLKTVFSDKSRLSVTDGYVAWNQSVNDFNRPYFKEKQDVLKPWRASRLWEVLNFEA